MLSDSAGSARERTYWSFSGPDAWRMSVSKVSAAFVADPELVAALETQATPVAVVPGHALFREGDAPAGVYLVKGGEVTLKTRHDGDVVLRLRACAGSLLGVPAVVGAKPYSLTAEVERGAEVSMLSCEDFLHLMRTDPCLSFHVLRVLSEEVRFAREALARM